MLVKSVFIEKFRGFREQNFTLGSQVTLIAGQNGTQKSTLLGILTQTFTIPLKEHIFSNERPLSGGTYRSSFKDKFKLSPELDLPGEHCWTLFFNDKGLHPDLGEDGGFTIESIPRSTEKDGVVRFWQKGNREQGSGYVHVPVIYLSLKRLIPLAEAGRLKEQEINLTAQEKQWFAEKYNKVLISNDNIRDLNYLTGTQKTIFGVTSDYYDWNSNSAGQDNLGRILLAILSFKRLQEKFGSKYKGGILAIDEIDAALYPASQVYLLERLFEFASRYKIQVLATTHSLLLLEEAIKIKGKKGRLSDIQALYLIRQDNLVQIKENITVEEIRHNLNLTLGEVANKNAQKTLVFTEDKEAEDFLKAILKQKYAGKLKFISTPLGSGNLIDLARRKLRPFHFPHSIAIVDADVQNKLDKSPLITKNFLCLPGDNQSPEQLLAKMLNDLSDVDFFWNKYRLGYSKQICFKSFSYNEIMNDRNKAKSWYNEQVCQQVWGRNARLAYNLYIKNNFEEVAWFLEKFDKLFEQVKKV